MARIYWKLEQNTEAWHRARAGIPTSSEFDAVMTPKTEKPAEARFKYGCRLIAQRLLNWQPASLDTIKHIEDGRQNEPFAVAQLELITDVQTHRVGFVTTADGRFGASPDRAVGGHPDAPDGIEEGSLDAVLEVKCPTIPTQFEYLLAEKIAELKARAKNKPGDDGADVPYRCQRQGQLYVAEADRAIFYSYAPRTPACHVVTGRDEPFIRKLADCLERFSDELDEMTECAKSLGVYQAFTELRTPLDQEYGENIRREPMETEEELAEILEGAVGGKLSWGA